MASDGIAGLTVTVPEDAVVFINGQRTTKTGISRDYYSVGLKPGYGYRYVVRVQIERDGNVVGDTQNVVLRVGDRKSVTFDFSGHENSQVAKSR
jgi:uncharacterized protein (TIGR03000 family)